MKRLKDDFVIVAEGYLFEMERRGYLKAGPFVPEVVLDSPEALKELHREFMRCGSDVIVAFTYYAHRDKLKVIGREDDLEKMNRQALQIAKEVAKEGNALVAGNICNTWVYDPDDESSKETVRQMYEEQVLWAKDEGADFMIAETLFYLGEALIALDIIKKHGMAAVITLAPWYPQTLDGHRWEDACRLLEEKGADVVGLNCGMGPKTMMPLLRKIKEKVSCPVAALPVPYHTDEDHKNFQELKDAQGNRAFPVNLDSFLYTRQEIADFANQAKDAGIRYIGLCCGGQPHHIRAIAETLGRTTAASKYSPDMSKHAMLGNDDIVRQHNKKMSGTWKD